MLRIRCEKVLRLVALSLEQGWLWAFEYGREERKLKELGKWEGFLEGMTGDRWGRRSWQASHMMISGVPGCGQEYLLVVIWAKDFEFYYFDISSLKEEGCSSDTMRSLRHPVHVVYSAKEYEFDYFFSLEGFNHKYFLVQQANYICFYRSQIP